MMNNNQKSEAQNCDAQPVLARPACSLSVSSAEMLSAATTLDRFAGQLERNGAKYAPDNIREVVAILRAQAVWAKMREPVENAGAETPAPKIL
jgi:hypothetical protein